MSSWSKFIAIAVLGVGFPYRRREFMQLDAVGHSTLVIQGRALTGALLDPHLLKRF